MQTSIMNYTLEAEDLSQLNAEDSMFVPWLVTGILYLLVFMCFIYICIKCGCMRHCTCTSDPVEESAEVAVCVQAPVVIPETHNV